MGSLALAGHAVVRFEALDTAAGERAAAAVEAVGLHRSDSSFRYRGIEVLRPFVGLERTRARLDYGEPVRGLVDGVHELRARLQLVALEERRAARAAGRQGPHGRARGVRAAAAAGSPTGPRRCAAARSAGVIAATDALDAYGEHYTAARLMVDALVRIPDPDAPPRRPPRGCARWARSRAPRSSAEARGG